MNLELLGQNLLPDLGGGVERSHNILLLPLPFTQRETLAKEPGGCSCCEIVPKPLNIKVVTQSIPRDFKRLRAKITVCSKSRKCLVELNAGDNNTLGSDAKQHCRVRSAKNP